MKDIFESLDKIRWHLRSEKLPSLQKVLRYKFASKETINYFNQFINFERILINFDIKNLFYGDLDTDQSVTLNGILTSFQELPQIESDLINSTISMDRQLNIIKCLYMQRNFASVLMNFDNVHSLLPIPNITNEKFLSFQKATWKLIAEVLLCYADSLSRKIISVKQSSYTGESGDVFSCISFSIEILFNLLKFQELCVSRRYKTSVKVYSNIIGLFYLAFSVYINISIKYDNRESKISDMIKSLVYMTRTFSYSFDVDMAFTRPFFQLWISLDLIKWFGGVSDNSNEKSIKESVFSCFNFNVEETSSLSYKLFPSTIGNWFSTILDHILSVLHYNGPNVELSRLSNFESRRKRYQLQIQTMLDIVVILLSQTKQKNISGAILLKNLPIGFEDPHQYLQLSLVLFTSKHYMLAKNLCERILAFDSKNQSALNILLQILVNIRHEHQKSLDQIASSLETFPSSQLLFHARAVTYIEQSFETLSAIEARNLLCNAKQDILKAIEYDDNDHELYFHASLIFGLLDELENGILYGVSSIKRSLFDSRPYQLLFALLVSKRAYSEAINLLNEASKEFPNDFSLIYSRILFEHEYYGVEVALDTAKCALKLWYILFGGSPSSSGNAKKRPGLKNILCPPEVKYSKSIRLPSKSLSAKDGLAASSPKELSESISCIQQRNSIFKFSNVCDIRDSYYILFLLYIKMGEFYNELNYHPKVLECIEEVLCFNFVTPDILLLQAKYYLAENNADEALRYFESALYIDPYHIKTLHSLTHYYLKSYENGIDSSNLNINSATNISSLNLTLAEETARKLVKVEPKNFKSWQCLGKVLLAAGNYEESTFCLSNALELENSYYIIPLKTIYRRFRPSDVNV